MGKKIVQKMSKKKYQIINPRSIKDKYLKPISNREQKFLKERSQLGAIFQIYLTLISRITNGSFLIKDSLLALFGINSSHFSNILSTIVGGLCSYNNIEESIDRYNSVDSVEKLGNKKYVLRDKDFMEKNYYFLSYLGLNFG